MPTEMTLPQVGEDVQSAVVLSVLVSKGDHVEKDQPVLELESDKATTEVPSTQAGTVQEILVEEGDEVKSGQAVITFSEQAATSDSGDEAKAEGKDAEERDQPEAEAQAEAQKDEQQAESEQAQADTDTEARPSADTGGSRTGQSERRAPPSQRARGASAREDAAPSGSSTDVATMGPPPASPSVRTLARELGVALEDVPGTGAGGRVTEDDVKSHARTLIERFRAQDGEHVLELPDFSELGEVERVPMNAVRRAIADNLSRTWSRIPQVSQFDRADITDLETFRKQYGDRAEAQGGKLTVTAVVVKVVGEAMQRFPDFNASVDMPRKEVIRKKFVHIGVAVDTEHGLLVPVVRDVDKKGLIELAVEISELAEAARNRKIGREQLKGGGMSVTNLGGLGTTNFTPVVTWPQVAIVGIGRAATEAVWRDDEFVPRTILPLCVTYDHRAVDGADAARFLRWVAEVLEQPLRLTMEP